MLGIWEGLERGARWSIQGHDTAFHIGMFGDPSWAAILAAKVSSGEGIGCLGGGHLDAGLSLLTNHAPPDDSDKQAIAKFWGAWWETHQHLSQEDWLCLGFEKAGVTLHQRPSKEDWPTLLALLGQVQQPGESDYSYEEDGSQVEVAPDHLRYNAYRWLRDSGFEPIRFVIGQGGQASTETKNGLLEYQRQERKFRTALPGRLAFAPGDDWGWGLGVDRTPVALQPKGQIITHLILAGIFAAGIAALRMAKKSRTRDHF